MSYEISLGQNRCASDILHEKRMINDQEYHKFRSKLNSITQKNVHTSKASSIIKIPVVVHVVYFEDSLHQNISDEQIYSQIDVLNKDFNKLNWDTMKTPSVWKSLIADCEIEYVLANRDPFGNVTNGITRRSTDINEIGDINSDFIYSTANGGQDIWDRNSYLNIWVCAIPGGVYGFSSYPGAPAKSDGIVVDYKCFGTIGTASEPTHLGRTLTHELGHWFDLFHLWGISECGDDLVDDTPEQQKANYGCPFFPSPSSVCPNGPNGDMFNNYMDYADDNCMNMFTHGQKNRMHNTLNNVRSTLFNSTGYNSISEKSRTTFKLYPLPASNFVNIRFENETFVDHIELLDIQGNVVNNLPFNGTFQIITLNTTNVQNGMYLIKLHLDSDIIVNRLAVWHQ